MKTLIINGSPKAKNGNTEVFIQQFIKGAGTSYEVCYLAKEDSQQLAEYMKQFDTIIVAMPLYIHAMPGIVMKLIGCMEPATDAGKSMGFIVQFGFMESAHSKYLEKYLSSLARHLNYNYLGTVVRGGSSGTSMMPDKMNKKLFKQMQILGEHFEKEGSFNIEIMNEMAKLIELSKGKSRVFQFLSKIGIGDSIFWNQMLKKNNAMDKVFDKPFAEKNA
ncbi:MAG: NAD(P)H-dependent oxidoreductase [Eubacteriales bacterium]|nr:NAD(P)H-dependent oxidoreductase [Eubacteriales bacterium]